MKVFLIVFNYLFLITTFGYIVFWLKSLKKTKESINWNKITKFSGILAVISAIGSLIFAIMGEKFCTITYILCSIIYLWDVHVYRKNIKRK